jgi:uncharacterized protein YyaL (SSP411 family)
VLEDYACLADGLFALYSVTGDVSWFQIAHQLVDDCLERFCDDDGRWADTAHDAEPLITRPADPSDNASPSGRSAAAMALVTLAALTGESRYREAADTALRASASLARTAPRFAGWGLAAAEALLDGPLQVAVVGDLGDDRTRQLHRAALMLTRPGAVVAVGPPGSEEPALLAGRGEVDGAPAAYPCQGFVCRLPVTDPGALVQAAAALS